MPLIGCKVDEIGCKVDEIARSFRFAISLRCSLSFSIVQISGVAGHQ